MVENEKTTHTGLTVSAVKVLGISDLSDKEAGEYREDAKELSETELAEKYGAGMYDFVVNLDGVDVVIASAKAGNIDVKRAKLAKAKAAEEAAALAPPPPPSA